MKLRLRFSLCSAPFGEIVNPLREKVTEDRRPWVGVGHRD